LQPLTWLKPQGLKPSLFLPLRARLKPCASTLGWSSALALQSKLEDCHFEGALARRGIPTILIGPACNQSLRICSVEALSTPNQLNLGQTMTISPRVEAPPTLMLCSMSFTHDQVL